MKLRLTLHNITKHFNEVQALRGIDATVSSGDRICVLGHNGAGKSTLLHIISTLSRPLSGRICFEIDDAPVTERRVIRRWVILSAHESMLYDDLTAMENLRFVNGLYRLDLTDEALEAAIKEVGMVHARHTLLRACSTGMRQRLSFLRALLPRPALLLLDEPFSGLDQKGAALLKGKLERTCPTWVMVTHQLRLGYQMANRFWILRHGRIISDQPKSDLSFEALEELLGRQTPDEVLR